MVSMNTKKICIKYPNIASIQWAMKANRETNNEFNDLALLLAKTITLSLSKYFDFSKVFLWTFRNKNHNFGKK